MNGILVASWLQNENNPRFCPTLLVVICDGDHCHHRAVAVQQPALVPTLPGDRLCSRRLFGNIFLDSSQEKYG